MKANSEKAFREKNWRTIFETMEDNLLTVLDVLHEEYGFGEKRLMQFLLSVQNKAAQYNEMLDDGVIDDKTGGQREKYAAQLHEIIKTRAKYQLPPSVVDIFNQSAPTAAELDRSERQKRKNKQVSVTKAAELQNSLQVARAWAGKQNMNRWSHRRRKSHPKPQVSRR